MVIGEPAQYAIPLFASVASLAPADIGVKLATDALLFGVSPHRSVERLDVRSIGRIVKAVAIAKGFDPAKWHPHLLRQACGTHMHDHGIPRNCVPRARERATCRTL